MKKRLIKNLIMTTLFVIFNNQAHSQQLKSSGGVGGGGGDDCESRIKIITSDLSDWIKRGGSKQLDFKDDLTAEGYNQAMINVLDIINSDEQISSAVECTSDKIFINNTEKTCRWEKVENAGIVNFNILCNYDRFMKGISDYSYSLSRVDAQYQLIHHEVAGIAGVEGNYEDRSKYHLSNQIVESLGNVVVRKLVIKTQPNLHKPITGCKLFVNKDYLINDYKILLSDKKALMILQNKEYELVSNESEADFKIYFNKEFGGNTPQPAKSNKFFSPFVFAFESGLSINDPSQRLTALIIIEHINSSFSKEIRAQSQVPFLVKHPDYLDIEHALGNANSVNEKIRLENQLDPSLNFYTEPVSLFADFAKQVPSCSDLLGL